MAKKGIIMLSRHLPALLMKKILGLIWDEFILGGHLLSIGAVSVVWASAILLKINITWDFLVIVYLLTHSVYLYNRYKELKSDRLVEPERSEYLEDRVKSIKITIISFAIIAAGFSVYFGKIQAFFFALLLFILSILYSVSLKMVTRKIIAFKSLFVALIWSLTLYFLAFYYSYQLSWNLFVISCFLFARIFIHEEALNLRDARSDKQNNLLTLALILSKKRLVNILMLINQLSAGLCIVAIYLKLLPLYSLILIILVLYASYYLQRIKNENIKNDPLYDILIDGEPILWAPMVLVGIIFT